MLLYCNNWLSHEIYFLKELTRSLSTLQYQALIDAWDDEIYILWSHGACGVKIWWWWCSLHKMLWMHWGSNYSTDVAIIQNPFLSHVVTAYPVFILWFLLWREIRNAWGDHWKEYYTELAQLELNSKKR